MQPNATSTRGWIALVLGLFAIVFLVAQGAEPDSDEAPDPSEVAGDVAEAIIDKAIQAGVGAAPIRYDDPLLGLKSRTIVMAGEIHAAASRAVCSKLLYLDIASKDPIHLYITTDGGWASNAYAITGVMQSLRSPVHTYAAGDCSSAGAMILAAGTVRHALPNSIIMVHPTGDPEDEKGEFSQDRTDTERDEGFWKRHAKLPKEWFPFKENKAYYLHPGKALEYGVVDVVVKSGRPERK